MNLPSEPQRESAESYDFPLFYSNYLYNFTCKSSIYMILVFRCYYTEIKNSNNLNNFKITNIFFIFEEGGGKLSFTLT